MNGNSGIVPTVDLATNNNNGYPYPVYPMMYGNGGFGNGMFGGDIWGILLIALLFGNGGWGGFGGFGGGFAGMTDGGLLGYAIGNNATKGDLSDSINSLHISNQIEGVRDDVNEVQNAICSSTASINSNISNGFYSSEIANTNRQMANMQQAFNNQLSTLQSFNGLERQLCECCADNRLATANLGADIAREACNTRFADANNTRDIIDSNNRNSQAILDKLCQLELDNVKSQLEAKNDIIAQLRQENLYARGQASQIEQTAQIRTGQATTANQLVAELRSCPIPSQPVYGNQPIFTCQPNYGCGCNGNFTTSQFI